MKRILALIMTGVLMLTPMTVSAATSVDAEAVKKAAEAAEQASKAAAEAARAATQAAQSTSSAAQAAQTAAQSAAQAAQTASQASQTASRAAQTAAQSASQAAQTANQAAQAAQAAASKSNNSASYGTYIAGNVDNSVTNNYTYKITVKGSGSKTPKVTITGGGSSSSGGKVSASEPPFVHTVLNAPGLDGVIPVGQGGKLVLNGKKTRATFVMRESTSGKVDSAKILAAQIGGSVKNVVETYAPGVRFSKCQVDFKVYGCKNGDIYRVYQMGANGTWDEVQVDEVRDGHVVCTVYKTGTFAFIKMN